MNNKKGGIITVKEVNRSLHLASGMGKEEKVSQSCRARKRLAPVKPCGLMSGGRRGSKGRKTRTPDLIEEVIRNE